MRRVAEIIYVVPEQREEFIKGAVNPDLETQKALWMCGVRNQQYFELNDLFFMTFEYKGRDFKGDMQKMAAYLNATGHLVEKRRKDVPASERKTTNWWAPVKRIASILEKDPSIGEREREMREEIESYFDGRMSSEVIKNDIAYDADDWSDCFYI